jgi:hypothetical protein
MLLQNREIIGFPAKEICTAHFRTGEENIVFGIAADGFIITGNNS